jgi:hypothetical protein
MPTPIVAFDNFENAPKNGFAFIFSNTVSVKIACRIDTSVE